jgi:hypothetical protein
MKTTRQYRRCIPPPALPDGYTRPVPMASQRSGSPKLSGSRSQHLTASCAREAALLSARLDCHQKPMRIDGAETAGGWPLATHLTPSIRAIPWTIPRLKSASVRPACRPQLRRGSSFRFLSTRGETVLKVWRSFRCPPMPKKGRSLVP